MSSMQTECLSQILVCFSSFAGHVASLRRTQICEVANWLIEPSSHPLPVFAQFVSFNSYRKRSVETKLSSFPLFISGGKYTKATNSSLVLIRQKRQWSEPPPQPPQPPKDTLHNYEAEQMKTSLSPGGGEVYG